MSEIFVTEELGEEGGPISSDNGNSDLVISSESTGGAAGIGVSDKVESIYQADAQPFVKDKPNGENGQEDGGKEEMFVDCAEEIEVSGSQQILEGDDGVEVTGVHELNNGIPVQDLMDNMEYIRDKLEKALAREANISQEYKEERTATKGELVHLHSRLKALNVKLLSLGKNDGLLDQHPSKVAEKDEMIPESNFTVLEIINKSSKLVGDALAAHSQSESINRDLQAAIQVKEIEVENLSQKIMELSVSHDAISSALSSEKENYSRLSEDTIHKDRHIEDIANRILSSLPMEVHKEGLSDESIQDKYTCLEEGISVFIAKNNQLLSEIDQLKKFLTEIAPNSNMEEDEAGILSIACGKLSELKKKEFDLEEQLRNFEEANTNLVKQLDEKNAFLERVNTDIMKLTADLEHEKTKYVNTKEKLGMAVTKGKALVQQRDSLKQLLADKTSELEKCLNDLQDKSSALEAAEENKSLLLKLEALSVSLQETITQKDSTLNKCAEILSEAASNEEIQSAGIIENLIRFINERSALKATAMEFQKFLDVLSMVSFPESVPSNELDAKVKWLVESLRLAKEEALKHQNEIVEIRENAAIQMDHVTASLLAEAQEKNYLQQELEDIRGNFEGIVEKEKHVSSEKNHILDLLLDAAGIVLNSQSEVDPSQSEIAGIVDECIAKIKTQGHESLESAQLKEEVFEKLKSFLYVRDQELRLYALLLEEDMLDRKETDRLSNEVADLTRSLTVLRDEKVSLQKELNRSEEKSTLVREKLTMAVKKGKGLVQDRENLRGTIDEKNNEIERLKADKQEQEAACNDLKDQIRKLLNDVDHVQKLEADNDTTKKERDQLEHYLIESNNMLQQLVESLDGIELQAGLTFKEPVEKVKWLAGYLTECRATETLAQQELERLKDEVNTLERQLLKIETDLKSSQDALAEAENNCSQLVQEKTELERAKVLAEQELQKTKYELGSLESKFDELNATVKTHEDALTEAKTQYSHLLQEKTELEVAKVLAEQELQKTKEKLRSLESKFAEVSTSMQSREEALLLAEEDVSKFVKEKDQALDSMAAMEIELQKAKEENAMYINRISDADKTIYSLENAFSEAKKSLSLVSEENIRTLHGKSDVESEIMKLKEEVDSQTSKLFDATKTIKSLEDALATSESNMSTHIKENESARLEISDLNSKLTTCLQELDGMQDNMEKKSHEIYDQLTRLQLLMGDGSLSSTLKKCFGKQIGSLRDMDLILSEMRDHLISIDSNVPKSNPIIEDDSSILTSLAADLNFVNDVEMVNGSMEELASLTHRIIEGFCIRDKTLVDRVDKLSEFMDNLVSALLNRLCVTKDGLLFTLDLVNSLKHESELDKEKYNSNISMLEKDDETLLSACACAIHELESEYQKVMVHLSSIPLAENLRERFSSELGPLSDDVAREHQLLNDESKHVQTAKELLLSVQRSKQLTELFHNIKNLINTSFDDLHDELNETKRTGEMYLEEKDMCHQKISKLETDVGLLQNMCTEQRLRIEEYEAREAAILEEKKEIVSSDREMKVNQLQDFPLSVSEIRAILDKVNALEIPRAESEFNDLETHSSASVGKLFYIIDTFTWLHQQMDLEMLEREKLQSMLESQVLEIQHLKDEVYGHVKQKEESIRMNNELSLGLKDIVQKLGGDELVDDQKTVEATGLLPILQKLTVSSREESDNLRSKNVDLSTKLVEAQKVAEDLSSKVELLEDSNRAMGNSSVTANNKSILLPALPTQSEISDVQEMGAIVKSKAESSVQARTLRKGSSDQLAISIDPPESERLVNHVQDDEDKGHVFKSLNTSGLIPRQGKLVADRIDGIWVSGGRVLMGHPRARLGLFAYSLFLHMWLLLSVF